MAITVGSAASCWTHDGRWLRIECNLSSAAQRWARAGEAEARHKAEEAKRKAEEEAKRKAEEGAQLKVGIDG